MRFRSVRTITFDLAAASVTAVGGAALLGWALDTPDLAAWKTGTVPMAPATAVLSMLSGGALALCAHAGPGRWGAKPAAALAWTGIAASLILLVLRLFNTYFPAELLGLRLSGPSLDPTTGFVSPITAVGFLLVNATLLWALSQAGLGAGRRWLMMGVAGAITVGGFVLLLLAVFGPPILSSVGILPVAVNSSLVLLILGLALLVMTSPALGQRRDSPGGIWRGKTVYAAIFTSFSALAVAGAYGYYRAEEQAIRTQAEQELDTISQLKVSQLREWRLERLADASLISQSRPFSGLARRLVRQPGDLRARRELEEWWTLNHTNLQSDGFILTTAHGVAVASAPSGQAAPSALVSPEMGAVLRRSDVTLVDFHLDERERVVLATLVPVVDVPPADGIIGVLMLRLDPARFLYPFLGLLPSASRTAETLLVRRDGEYAQFLNPLRFEPGAAIRRRISLVDRQVLAVKAVAGETGLVDGLDYKGTPVMGVLRAIPGSPWFLIARKDTAEFRADLRNRMWVVTTFATIALFATAAGLGLVWRDQSARFYRSQAQLADDLRQSDERYRRYIESTSDSIFELNTSGFLTFVSPNWPALIGEPGDEAIGEPLERYVHPDDVALCRRYFEQVLSSVESPAAIEYRVLNRAGSVRWYSARGAALRDRDGNITGGVGIARDITERVDADRQAERVKERLELATRAAGLGIWDWDIETNAIVWDEKMFRLYGLAPDSVGIDYAGWMAGVHPDDRARVDSDVREALPGTTSYVSEFRAVWPDGTVRGIAAVGHVTTDANGRPVRMLGVNYDITERWMAEERLRSLLLEKEALLREVHHRVKNNLQVIMSLLRLEADRAGEPATIRVLGEMRDRIHAMVSLHELLYISNHFESVDLADYVHRISMQLFHSSSVGSGTIQLRFDLESTPVQIHQAIPCGLLVNELVSNSLKHGFPDGRSGEIRIELHAISGGPGLRLVVRDTGVGLPADVDERRSGSLGLQLVGDLARQLHGEIEIVPGPGAAFCLSFTPDLAHSSAEFPRGA